MEWFEFTIEICHLVRQPYLPMYECVFGGEGMERLKHQPKVAGLDRHADGMEAGGEPVARSAT